MSDQRVRDDMSAAGAPGGRRSEFFHEAYLYESSEEFLDGTSAFIEEGLDAGEAVLVAVDRGKIAALTSRLGAASRYVEFADMAEAGRNPARIIPLWGQFLDAHRGQGVRGIGEPIWPERSPAEMAECHLHEQLLNVAFDDGPGWSLLCPYDTGRLDPRDVERACGTHPHVARQGAVDASPSYREVADHPFRGELPAPPAGAERLAFDTGRLRSLRQLVVSRGHAAQLPDTKVDDLVLAVSELATNSIRHGAGRGVLQVWQEADVLICDVSDSGRARWDPLVGRRPPKEGQVGGMGIWIANQVCDLVQVRSTASGTTVRLHLRLDR